MICEKKILLFSLRGRLIYSFPPLLGVTHRHLSDHLSEVVENTINDLEQSKVSANVKNLQANNKREIFNFSSVLKFYNRHSLGCIWRYTDFFSYNLPCFSYLVLNARLPH